jgi:hypothetical protein
MEVGYTIKRAYFTLDGKPVDPRRLRQNDRLIVSIEGKSADSEEHQTVLVDMLPAGWEIEGPVMPVLETPKGDAEVDDTNKAYGFLGALTIHMSPRHAMTVLLRPSHWGMTRRSDSIDTLLRSRRCRRLRSNLPMWCVSLRPETSPCPRPSSKTCTDRA